MGTEARTIARLIHPHIVRVLEFGVEDKTPFLVMDYASNGTLRQRHPKGVALPLPLIVAYVKQVADALQYAHDEKLIHRDIKPENMLLGRRNDILLSDFGIALVAQSSRYQSAQEMAGTMAYMAPEQIQGKPRPASDQYSLGIVVYEWLSGNRPFHGSLTEMVGQHLSVPPPSLHEKIPTIFPAVEQVVITALEKDPHKRFASITAFANAFQQAVQTMQHVERAADSEAIKTSAPTLLHTGNRPVIPFTQSNLISEQGGPTRPDSENIGTAWQNQSMSNVAQGGAKEALRSEFVGEPTRTQSGPPTYGRSIGAPHHRGKRRPALIIALAMLAILIVGGSIAFTISELTRTTNTTGVRSTPATHATATHATATHATGTLEIVNFDPSRSYSFNAGQAFQNQKSPHIDMVLDKAVTVPAYGHPYEGIVDIPGHVLQLGAIGNLIGGIQSNGGFYYCIYNGQPCAPGCPCNWMIYNPQDFTGGQVAQNNMLVQLGDIDNPVNALIKANTPNSQQVGQLQIQPSEWLIGSPQSKPNATGIMWQGIRRRGY